MRRVSLRISELGLVIGDEIKIQLVDSVGGVSRSPFTVDTKHILDSEIFEIELLENENIISLSHYKITLPSFVSFYFKVPTNIEDIPHELTSLLTLACYENIIDKEHNRIYDDFLSKIDKYFLGEYVRLSTIEIEVIKLYEYYAENVTNSTNTIDIMELMDTYLSTIGK